MGVSIAITHLSRGRIFDLDEREGFGIFFFFAFILFLFLVSLFLFNFLSFFSLCRFFSDGLFFLDPFGLVGLFFEDPSLCPPRVDDEPPSGGGNAEFAG